MDNLIVENIKQRPLRTAISVVGVALGVILIVLMVGLARGMVRDSAERQGNVDAEIRFLPTEISSAAAANPLMMPARFAEVIMNGVQPTAEDPDLQAKPPIAGVSATTPVGEFIQNSESGIGFEYVDGIDFPSFSKTTRITMVAGRPLTDGKAPDSAYEVIVDRYYFDNNKDVNRQPLQLGSKIKTLGHEFSVVGVYEPSMLARIKMPLHTMQQLLGGAENCTFIMIRTTQPALAKSVKEALESNYPGYHAYLTSEIPALFSQGIRPLEIFLDVVIWLAVVISTLVILLAMYTTIIERTREIGILKSLGASKTFVVMTIEKEAALISALGVLFGFVVSVVGKYALEASTRLKIDIEPRWVLIATVVGIGCGLLGALYPALRAANLDVVEAISYE
ncbi:MAG: ABC transporter permease [Acidobacteria bacterium]|nr:ABC transporter permease [Acidobacteriota bacterium]